MYIIIIKIISTEAKHIKKGNYLLHDEHVYYVLSVEEHANHGNHMIKLSVENFESNHHTTLHFGLKHHVRLVCPEIVTYELACLLDNDNGKQYMSLLNTHTNEYKQDLYTDNKDLTDYFKKYFETNTDKFLTVKVVTIKIDKLHRIENDRLLEKIVHVDGFDMKHLYDHHHNHHH